MINTWSRFNYGLVIDTINSVGDFQESGPALTANLAAQSYTIDEILSALQDALNSSGALTYLVTFDRVNHVVTIAGSDTFSILTQSGANAPSAFWSLLGFSTSADLTGQNSYTATGLCGFFYYPQFMLQSYMPPENYQMAYSQMVNRTCTGRTELINFGIDKMIQFEIKFITSLQMDGSIIKNDQNGLVKARAFMSNISQKNRFEFVPDVKNPATFYKAILESTPDYSDGSGYQLKELYMDDLPNIYETGLLTLRTVS